MPLVLFLRCVINGGGRRFQAVFYEHLKTAGRNQLILRLGASIGRDVNQLKISMHANLNCAL